MTTSKEQDEKAKIWSELNAAEANAAVSTPATAEGVPAAETAGADAATKDSAAADKATAQTDDKAGTQAQADDPYATLHPVIRDEIRGMKSMLESAQSQLRTAHGHIGGLTSQLKEIRGAADKARAGGGDAPSAEQLREAQGSASAMAKLKADYPEFGTALDAALEERLKPMQERLAQPATELPAGEKPLTRSEFADLIVSEKHSGWKETVKTPEFRGWLLAQPDNVRALGASESPLDAVRLLDLHKEARTKAPKSDDQARLDAAAAIPSGRSAPAPKGKKWEEMSRAEQWAFLDEQDRVAAQSAGR